MTEFREREAASCPFCGCRPKFEPSSDEEADRIGNGGARVYCNSQRCPAKPSVSDGIFMCDDRGWRKYLDAAIKRWNRRHD